ncbi:MAG: DEAD/DEAH box helicase [Bacteroidales bacterium]|jgi:ATP-dependent RNA helicase RhlE|nr:DEAD/DEAH box helicase [Bacteroidales bacterium]
MIFEDLNLSRQLYNAIDDLGFTNPTPIQEQVCSVVLSGRDVVGIAQTGTGKTLAYLLPLLRDLKYSKTNNPRILILVPTRELVIQVVQQVESLTKYMTVRVQGVYGGANINTQAQRLVEGLDILVGTPGRLYDHILKGAVKIKEVKKLVIDEVDVMLDEGFRYQLKNIFDLLPERRQNLMFSATMTEEVDTLIDDFFRGPVKISVAVSGTPLDNIAQSAYPVPNFYTKVNLLKYLISDSDEYSKVLVFLAGKKSADRLFESLEEEYGSETCVIHSNKSQNYRLRSIKQFEEGTNRILVTTDVMARGLDLSKISHVINFDTPAYPENYMHRIGRSGRAEQEGKSILFFTEKEVLAKEAIEALMKTSIPLIDFPEEVNISKELAPEEGKKVAEVKLKSSVDIEKSGGAYHEKLEKNKKVNQGGSYLRKKKVYKKPQTRGDKGMNTKRK